MFVEIPAVFAVEDTYQIMVKANEPTVMWVKVGDRCFYDHSNGILKSDTSIHRMTVPAKLLDKAGQYSVCSRKMIDRKPYFSETGDVVEKAYEFRPVKGDKIRAYHISDAHNFVKEPVKAAETYGDIDFLILNGDIPDHSGDIKNFDNIYELCGRITKGNIPVVFARGNHDMRGIQAEKLESYTPVYNGKSYYTVRLGGFWGIILDCSEDKLDTSEEYGNTVCCHEFRMDETDFIEKVTEENKYSDDGIFCRSVICHVPFTQEFAPPFNIENDTYNKWTNLLNDGIKPNIMICGHMHNIYISRPGGEKDFRGQKFPVAVAAATNYKDYFAGTGFEFSRDGSIKLTVTDSEGKTLETYSI